MSRFVEAATALGLVSVLVPGVGQPRENLTAPGRFGAIRVAEEFLKGTYPDLAGRKLRYYLSAADAYDRPWVLREVSLQLATYMNVLDVTTREDMGHIVLGADFEFDQSLHLTKVRVVGQEVRFKENDAFADAARAHKEWSNDQTLAELKRAGAVFLPETRESIVTHLPLAAWRPFLGVLAVHNVRFILPDPTVRPESQEPYPFHWEVVLNGSVPTRAQYSVLVEPFGGRVMNILRTAPDF